MKKFLKDLGILFGIFLFILLICLALFVTLSEQHEYQRKMERTKYEIFKELTGNPLDLSLEQFQEIIKKYKD